MSESRVGLKVRVTGRVQGVAYRAWAKAEAELLGLAGWARNEPDGSVTVLLAGPSAAVDRMLHALRDGPPAASVSGVTAEPVEPPEEPGFAIRP